MEKTYNAALIGCGDDVRWLIDDLNNSKMICFLLTVTLVFLCACNSAEERKNPPQDSVRVIPKPQSVKYLDGSFKIDASTVVIYPGDDPGEEPDFSVRALNHAIGNLLSQSLQMQQAGGLDLSGQANAIVLRWDESIPKDEGYMLEIAPEQITLSAGSPAGMFYAVQTFKQLLPPDEGKTFRKISLPCVFIEDYPSFDWRGMHLDVSRHFFPADSIKRFIEYLAMHKMNVFHWHLTDDQGWRIEIRKHPELTEIGAWREDTREREWSYDQFPVQEGKPVYGGFYTQEEIKEIVRYAADRFITIVPEIDVPGHSWAALYANPHLSCSGIPYFHSASDPFSFTDPFCAGNPGSYQLLEDVFSEVIDLFPSEYIHIGGDEAKKSPWEHCAKCRNLMEVEGLKNVEQLQSYFIDRVGRFIVSKGRSYIGWDEILEGGLPEKAAVMSWRGEEGGIEAAKIGNPVVMVPSHTLYFNRCQFDPALEGMAGGLVSSLEDVYGYNPVPAELSEEEQTLILGIQGCLWTENIQTWHGVQERLFPRLLALSEIAWNQAENRDFVEFRSRMLNHCRRLDARGIHYFLPAPTGLEENNAFLAGEPVMIHLENPLESGRIVYTTDGTEPDEDAAEYHTGLTIHDDCTVKSALILPSGKMGLIRTSHIEFLEPTSPISVEQSLLTPGIRFSYMEGSIITLNDLEKMVFVRDGVSDELALPTERSEDGFGLEFEGYIKIDSLDIYSFQLTSDDGTRLFIGERMVADNDGIHGPQLRKGQIALAPGFHPIRIQFFEGNYGEEMVVSLYSQKSGKMDLNKMLFR